MGTVTYTFQIGEPVVHRGVAIAPLFPRRDPVAAYVTLDEALTLGLRIEETSEAGAVPELAVTNPLDRRVLLYDGEELVGAKQNRILNVSVLVEAGTKVAIPVSCVEAGRWHRTSAQFAAAPHVSSSELRRRKAEQLAAAPLARGLAQREVWDAVADKARRMAVSSETGAASDTFAAYADRLAELEAVFPAQPGQAGVVMAIDGSTCLDWVSRPDAFARLWPKLRRGYLLDALETLDRPVTDPRAAVEAFVADVARAAATRGPSAGPGEDVRVGGERLVGSGLELEGELLQLCAFSTPGAAAPQGRIARPSRRHG
jgi:hypothetical protein